MNVGIKVTEDKCIETSKWVLERRRRDKYSLRGEFDDGSTPAAVLDDLITRGEFEKFGAPEDTPKKKGRKE